MNVDRDGLVFFRKTVGVASILAGFLLMILFFIMQGAPLFVLGIPFIIFGITMLLNKIYLVLLILLTPIVVVFSLFIIMSMIDKSIPKYAQMPFEIGLGIIAFYWFVVGGGCYLWKKVRTRKG